LSPLSHDYRVEILESRIARSFGREQLPCTSASPVPKNTGERTGYCIRVSSSAIYVYRTGPIYSGRPYTDILSSTNKTRGVPSVAGQRGWPADARRGSSPPPGGVSSGDSGFGVGVRVVPPPPASSSPSDCRREERQQRRQDDTWNGRSGERVCTGSTRSVLRFPTAPRAGSRHNCIQMRRGSPRAGEANFSLFSLLLSSLALNDTHVYEL